jgi:imidazole glycerol-phosphate synthase subunit HisH
MIVIVDYNLGNLGSVFNMLKYLGFESEITSEPYKILHADKLILSGVGSFDAGMGNLIKLGLIDILHQKVIVENTPILGICLGMQLMGGASEEGERNGLGWIKGKSVKFDSEKVRVPHMSWNQIKLTSNSKLFLKLEINSKFYFAHSYHLIPDNTVLVSANSSYGEKFVAAIENDNILGVQFHPEKSHRYGMQLFNNFISYY